RSLPPGFHSALIEKVTGEDAAAADKAMRDHVRFGLSSVLEQLAKAASATDWRLKRDDSISNNDRKLKTEN
ncbi:MAG: hypothetical protein J2P41_17940, partial [Blastocatellia bacterium]|nr:hypothetical protein [Blastocatellia bacterium]